MSLLPSGSTARTWNTWAPPPSGPGIVCGVVQGANSPSSSAHSNWVTEVPSSSSKPSNVNVALVSVVSSSGPSVISVSGPDMSTTVQCRVAPTGSMLPASSIAWTTSVCGPAVKTSISSGVSQPPRSSPSSVHWKSSSSAGEKSSVPENSNMLIQFGVDEPSGGPLVMMVEGGVTSGPRTSHSYSAGVRSIQPNSLIACTMNSWSPSTSGPTVTGDSQ